MFWLADGFIIPGIAEKRHDRSRYCKEKYEVVLSYIVDPHCARYYSKTSTRTSVEPSGSSSGRFVEDVGLSSSFTAPIVAKPSRGRVRMKPHESDQSSA